MTTSKTRLRSALRRGGLTALTLVVGLAFAPRTVEGIGAEILRWTHPTPDQVIGFVVHYGFEPGDYIVSIDIRKPPAVDGVFEVAVPVLPSLSYYFAVTAYDFRARESDYSIERCRGECTPAIGVPGAPFVVSGSSG